MTHYSKLMAYERLRDTVTKGDLWTYILSELGLPDASPSDLRRQVTDKCGARAASINLCSVIYRLRREGLVRESID